MSSLVGLLHLLHGDHFLLNAVGVGEVLLRLVGHLRALHVLLALLVVDVGGALLLDVLQVADQVLHLVLAGLLVALDVLDHAVDALLGLIVLLVLGHLHVHLDRLRGLHAQVVLNHVHVLVHLRDLLLLVQHRQLVSDFALHLLLVDRQGGEVRLQNVVVAIEVPHLGVDFRHQDFEHIVLRNPRHQLLDLYRVVLIRLVAPHIPVRLFDLQTFEQSFGDVFEVYDHVRGHQRNYASQSIAEGFVQSRQLLDEVKVSVLELTDFGHKLLVVVSSEAERVDREDAQVLVLLQLETLTELMLGASVLAVRKQKDGGDFVGVLSLSNGFESEAETRVDVGASPRLNARDVPIEGGDVLGSHALEPTYAVPGAFESDDRKSIGRSQGLDQIAHGLFDEVELLAAHRAADVDHADEVNARPIAALGAEGAHGGEHDFLLEFGHGTLRLDVDVDLGLLHGLFFDLLDQRLVVVENIRQVLVRQVGPARPKNAHIRSGHLLELCWEVLRSLHLEVVAHHLLLHGVVHLHLLLHLGHLLLHLRNGGFLVVGFHLFAHCEYWICFIFFRQQIFDRI